MDKLKDIPIIKPILMTEKELVMTKLQKEIKICEEKDPIYAARVAIKLLSVKNGEEMSLAQCEEYLKRY